MDEVLPVCQLVELADGLSLPFDSRTDDGQYGSYAAHQEKPKASSYRAYIITPL
jgi:hypothetical protein